MVIINREPSTTFDEWLLEPQETRKDHLPHVIDLSTPIVRSSIEKASVLFLKIPFLSAAMQSVSGPRLCIALAREGGLGVIFCSQSIESQARMVAEVKSHKAGFVPSDSNLSPDASLAQAIDLSKRTGHSTIAITEGGVPHGRLLGVLTDNDFWMELDDVQRPVREYMTPFNQLIYGEEGISLSDANTLLWRHKKSCLPIIDGDKKLVSLVFKKDYQHAKDFPFSLVDEKKRFRVGAAVNTRDFEARVPALLEEGADVLVLDSSDGFSVYQKDAVRWIKNRFPDVIVGAGNVVNKEGFEYLVDAGADFVKVGIGGGSICTTREMKAIGRGQADAVMEIAKCRDELHQRTGSYVPIISDGGIVYDSHIILALAMGADAVMMGRYFAMTDESPPPVRDIKGQFFKQYWGEGSQRARNWQRYIEDGGPGLRFEEGIEGVVPLAGPLANKVRLTNSILKSTMSNCGVRNLSEFHERATLRRVSPATLKESAPHDVLRFEYTLMDREKWG